MLNVILIGDELHFRGHRIALLVDSGVPASTMGDFVDNLEAGLLNQDERPDPCNCAHMKECPNYKAEDSGNVDTAPEAFITDLLAALKHETRGGLLKFTDVERVITLMKEEQGLE